MMEVEGGKKQQEGEKGLEEREIGGERREEVGRTGREVQRGNKIKGVRREGGRWSFLFRLCVLLSHSLNSI